MVDTPDKGPIVMINGMEYGPGRRQLSLNGEDPSQLRIPGTTFYSLLSVTKTQPHEDGLLRVSTRFPTEASYPSAANITRGVLFRVTGGALERVTGRGGYATLMAGEQYILAPPGLATRALESLPSQFLEPVDLQPQLPEP